MNRRWLCFGCIDGGDGWPDACPRCGTPFDDGGTRWLCTGCGAEGRGAIPAACPRCCAVDGWYSNAGHADDPGTMQEIFDDLLG